MKNILSLLVSEAGLNSVQGLTVLSTFVQYCGSYANANKARINNDGQNNNNNNNNSAKIKSAIIRKIMS